MAGNVSLDDLEGEDSNDGDIYIPVYDKYPRTEVLEIM
jgi:hypothetical protein